jgi:hypothetical protein
MVDESWDVAESKDLDAALDQYGRSARCVKSAPQRRWVAYAAAGAGAGMALPTGAQAAVIYSGPQNISAAITNTSGGGNGTSTGIDLDLDGNPEFNIRARFTGEYDLFRVDLRYPAAGVSFLSNGNTELKIATAGVPISFGTASGAPNAYLLRYVSVNNGDTGGDWPQSVAEYAVVKFNIGTGTATTSHFAWVRLRWDNIGFGPGNTPNRITAIDWAYESQPNTPIIAAVPEPGSALLALLATGAAGVMAWKRRKKLGA